MSRQTKNWLFAGLLTVPMIIFFGSYWLYHPSYLTPTGFTQYDNVGYIAYAKQYLDADNFSFFYSNPFNDSGQYPLIYFQTQSLFFAFLIWIGISANVILIPFTLICSFFCFRILIAIFDHLIPKPVYRRLSIILFAWGGGLFVVSSILFQIASPISGETIWNNLFLIDPGGGSWGLSFGRSLFFSCEAYYHLLFMASILFILKKKWKFALLLIFLLSISHPFSGIELISILCVWTTVEKIIVRNKNIPWFFIFGLVLILTFHAWYYLYYLNQFSDHKSVSEQYSLNWYIKIVRMIPAYAIVFALSFCSIRLLKKNFFHSFYNRLFTCWFITAFLLAKHELFMKPMQPIHFTRGYIWTSLFLIGLPGLEYLFHQLQKVKYKKYIIGIFVSLFLLDNFMWIFQYSIYYHNGKSTSYINTEEKDILTALNKICTNKTLIIGFSDERVETIPYLATIYTKAYTWTSHTFTTPFAAKKRIAYNLFIQQGIIDTAWRERDAVFIFRKNDAAEWERSLSFPYSKTTILETANYKIVSAWIR